MNKHSFLLAGALAALTIALPAAAADDATKMTMKQADQTHAMAKKQAKADEKSAEAQCGNAAAADPKIDVANGEKAREFLGQSTGFENELISQSNFPH